MSSAATSEWLGENAQLGVGGFVDGAKHKVHDQFSNWIFAMRVVIVVRGVGG